MRRRAKKLILVEGGLHKDLFERADAQTLVWEINRFATELPLHAARRAGRAAARPSSFSIDALRFVRRHCGAGWCSSRCDTFRIAPAHSTSRESAFEGAMLAVVKSAPVDGPEGTSVRDCPVPKPGPDEVLIRVAAAAVCGTDKHIYHWDPSIRD